MDKLKIFLSAVNKYRFWGLCGVMLLTSLACWWLATSGLAEQFKKQKSKIDGNFNSIRVQPGHPNQEVIKYIRDYHETLKKGVIEAWEILYGEQKEKNPFPTKALGEDFKKQFENLKPDDSLDSQYRELYQNNFIKSHLPTLRKMIDVRRPKDERAAGGKPPADRSPPLVAGMRRARRTGRNAPGHDVGEEVEWIGVVDWDENDYARLVDRFQWRKTPSTLAVVLAQEDLWVYEALLRVIKNANEGAAGQAEAAVKRIEALQIGKDAAADGSETPSASGGSSDEQSKRQLIDSRYVDDKGRPLPYASKYPYANHPYAEFKMMPIRMKLVMDQRRLPKLLVECANSNMPIEVRRIRILKTQGGPSDAAVGKDKKRPSRSQMRGGRHKPSRKIDGQQQEAGTFDIPVEIHAVIYIYNRPTVKN